jgi:hypothetical protein
MAPALPEKQSEVNDFNYSELTSFESELDS